MAGDAQFGPAPDSGAPQRAVTPQIPRDPVALRESVKAALAQRCGVSGAYAGVIRPFLAADRRAVACSAAHAALAELVPLLPLSDEGLGRRAGVLAGPGVVGELDARAVADGLEAGGWSTELIALAGQDANATVDAVVAARSEVLVVPVADAEQVLASQLPLRHLRRLNAPPLIVGVAFAGADATAVAADHVVDTVEALSPLLRRRMSGGAGGAVAWGVRMHRDAGGLVVAPAGLLDTGTVERLREIVETRRTMYPKIVIDLRELLEAERSGLDALVSWDAEQPWDPTVAALGDARTLAALDSVGLAGALPLTATREP